MLWSVLAAVIVAGGSGTVLIASPRHTAADLRHWKELELADVSAGRSSARLDRLLSESINEIAMFVAQGNCQCAVSWGKDSIVTAFLTRSVAPTVPLIHMRTTTHNPDCDIVRDAYFSAFPGQEYSEQLIHYTAGSVRENKRIWAAAIRANRGRKILGLRRDESSVRKLRFAIHGLTSNTTCCPIGRWTANDVFAFTAREGLPLHPAYACLGGGRYSRENLRVDELGDEPGTGMGRAEWEREYYGDELRRIEAATR